jgi:uncharacterized cupredoxin-like copper-binding protein
MKRRNIVQAAALLSVTVTTTNLAHAGPGHDKPKSSVVKKEQKDWGIAGDAKLAKRTIAVGMADNMRFTPDKLDIKLGETIRFQARNDGKVMHEFVIGTKEQNDKHAELMIKFPKMEHDEPYMAHVAPGKVAEIVWTFNRPGSFDFACLIAGHYQAGMIGKITVA